MRRVLLIPAISVVALSACSSTSNGITAPINGPVYPATLTELSDDGLRETIRLYVREALGADYVADIDDLTRRSEMTARDNGRTQAQGVRLPVTDRLFHLVMSDTRAGPRCWIKPGEDMPDVESLTLPQDAPCQPVLAAP